MDSRYASLTLAQIRSIHPGCCVRAFDAGFDNVQYLDVLVWPDEQWAEYDDGTNAIARYLIQDMTRAANK